MTSLVQQTDEWLRVRKNKIGASDAPVIMEVSPYKTPYQLWEEKVGLRPEQSANQAMKRGLALEDKARESFSKKTNILVSPEVVFHKKYDWMLASLDGIDAEQKNIVEIKCANRDDHQVAKDGKVPEKYYPQLQHQLEVTGLKMAYYFSFDGEDGVVVEVGRDDNYISNLVDEEKEFWKCMQDFIAPKMSPKDYVEQDDPEWKAYAQEYLSIQKPLADLTKRSQFLKLQLIEMANEKNSKGSGIKLCKIISKGHIDYASIPYLKGKNLDKYRGEPSTSWRITKCE